MSTTISQFELITGLPDFVAYLTVFIFGSMVGSFLNVVIHRVPRQESIVFPNSGCPRCGAAIRPYDNIPILSWLFLGGKCRSCREPISPRYPGVELLTALVFLLVFWRIGFTPILPVWLVLAAVLIALVFIDAEHMILPNVITYPLLVFAVAIRLVFPLAFSGRYFGDLGFWPATAMMGQPLWFISLTCALAGALVGGGSLWLVGEIWQRLRGVEAMGLGDVKMMLGVGALLGWRLSFLSIFIAAFVGALAGVILIARQKDKDFQAQIPFGIFLGIGSLISLLFGEQFIGWYLSTFVG